MTILSLRRQQVIEPALWEDARAFFQIAGDGMRRNPGRVVGLGLFWAWLQVVFVVAGNSPVMPFLRIDAHNQIWMFSLLVSVITCLATFFAANTLSGIVDRKALIIVAHLFMAVGSGSLALTVWLKPTLSLSVVGIVLTGLGSAVTFLVWGKQLAGLSLKGVLFHMIAGSFITAAVYLFTTFLVPITQQFVTVLLPAITGLLLIRTGNNKRRVDCSCPGSGGVRGAEGVTGTMGTTRADRIFSLDLLLLVVLVGLSFGMIRAMTFGHLTSSMRLLTLATVIGIAIGGLLLLATAIVFKKSNHLYLMSQISFPLLAAGFLLTPIVPTAFPWPVVVFSIGHNYFYVLLWVLYVDQTQQMGRNAVAVFAIGQFAFLGSMLIGSLIGESLMFAVSFSGQAITIISSVMVYLIIMGLTFMFRRSRAQKEAVLDNTRLNIEEACRIVAARFSLTPREADILILLAKGHSRSEICDMLYLSVNTVKSYTAHLYEKLGIHSRREAARLVEAERSRENKGL
jgi:DNA-binding CsgD family transcriptional regulator